MGTTKPHILLIEDDCLHALSAIPTGSVGMVLCDLPYGTTQNTWDFPVPLEPLWAQYRRILSPRGVIVLFSHGIFTAHLIMSASDMFRYKLTWVKSKATNFLNAKKQPLRKHEDICIFYRNQPIYTPQMSEAAAYNKGIRKDQLTGAYGTFQPVQIQSNGTRYPTDVVYFKTAEAEGPVWHSTQKPVELGRYLVATYTSPDMLVLDNSFGSGSLLVAAALEGRHAIGIELNEKVRQFKEKDVDLIGIAKRRLENHSVVKVVRRTHLQGLHDAMRAYLMSSRSPREASQYNETVLASVSCSSR